MWELHLLAETNGWEVDGHENGWKIEDGQETISINTRINGVRVKVSEVFTGEGTKARIINKVKSVIK